MCVVLIVRTSCFLLHLHVFDISCDNFQASKMCNCCYCFSLYVVISCIAEAVAVAVAVIAGVTTVITPC